MGTLDKWTRTSQPLLKVDNKLVHSPHSKDFFFLAVASDSIITLTATLGRLN